MGTRARSPCALERLLRICHSRRSLGSAPLASFEGLRLDDEWKRGEVRVKDLRLPETAPAEEKEKNISFDSLLVSPTTRCSLGKIRGFKSFSPEETGSKTELTSVG